MSNERRIKSLKTRQKSLLTSFGLIKAFVDGYQEETGAREVAVRLEHLVAIWNDFNAVQAELETLDEAAIEAHLKERVEFETAYFTVKGFLLAVNKNEPTSPRTSSSSSFTTQSPLSSHVWLPDIKLPVFAGNLDQWLNFHDLFVSLVHSSHELSNIQKFYYLRSSLSGDALKLVQTIALSANNYQVAWNLLLDHYQNPVRLKQSYVDSLFEFPSVRKESASELHSLVEKFEANVKVLHQLGEKTEFWDILLIRMLSIRLDPTTRRDWEEHASTLNAVSFQNLTTFIQRRVAVLQTIGKTTEALSPIHVTKKPVQRVVASHGASPTNQRKCVACSDHHPLYQCGVFSKLSVDEKEREVRRHQLCRNCLRKGHTAKECSSSSTCRKCRGHHHTQLCQGSTASSSKVIESPQPKENSSQQSAEQPSASVSATLDEHASCASAGRGRKSVLLATTIVIVVDDNGTEHAARALLDSGSECCFATESFSQLVKAQRKRIHLPIAGIGQSSTEARFKFLSKVRSRVCEYSTTVELLVLPKVAIDLPSAAVDTSSWEIPPGIQLADPAFCRTSPIDLILGAEVFFELFKVSGRIQLGPGLPTLINSVFGWVVSGKTTRCPSTTPIVANVATVAALNILMEKFWSIEDDTASTCYSVEETACEEHFRRTVSRTPEGRYIVSLPVKEDILANLGDNRRTAIRRFRLLQGQLARNDELYKQYRDFMDEYLRLGHMELVQDYQQPQHQTYHLPHHAVIREDSTTTKVRVVFDASCRTVSGPSLNDALMVGPVVQDDIRSIIMRSRTHPILLNADVKQMYRQILTDQHSSNLQHIVWSPSPDEPLQTYELKTVTYGTASAPFLATRVLQQLADDEQNDFPEAANVLRKEFYVDDLFSGANTVEEAIALRRQLESLLSRGGFELRKWASNEPAVVEDVPTENRALKPSVDLDRDQCIKTLGLHWEPATDVLRYKTQLPPTSTDETLTKRIALSHIARLFDPLGLVGPVVTTAKIFMQAIWTLLDDEGKPWSWDKELPPAFKTRWESYQTQLPCLNELRVQRCVLFPSPTSLQIHVFTDASEHAYGACVYLRSTNSNGCVKVALLTSKSKVAPLKKQSIPRLELCGALVGTQLYEKVMASLQLTAETFFWVDSTVVLCWLKSSPSSWTTFVANRVSKIQLATENCSWNHVAGIQNPADLISRGTTADNIIESNLWWNGPDWLQREPSEWPLPPSNPNQPEEALRETKKSFATAVPAAEEPSFIDEYVGKFSNYARMLRITAYCLRFLQNCRPRTTQRKANPFLTTEEINRTESTLIKLVQQQCFGSERQQLLQRQPVPAKSRLRWFHPFLDDNQVLRIGGRLSNSQLSFDSKHPVILPSSHAFSALLVRSFHLRHLHAAPQLLLTLLRLRYWIIGARNLVKRTVHSCVVCFRNRPKMIEQFMAELPASRVTATRPFTVTGIDYWGPIQIQPPHRRAAPRKAYVAVFVCFCTKAVHLELVADLTTAKFIQALRRFVSRRGLCSDIHSDNGRNFVGAANELRHLLQSQEHKAAVVEECNKNGIRWHFNPPKASHFGGLWEAAIASAQKHFVRVLGSRTLAFDDTETLLAQIECCLNSRPLVPVSDDPCDFEALTPGHFLTGSALKSVPDYDYSETPFNRLRHWQQTQKILQDLWQRWHIEYLSTLQPRIKWINPSTRIEIGQLVVIKNENAPPMRWETARIIHLHPGADGIVRVVTLQTPHGKFTRPVSKLCVLPISPSPSKEEISSSNLPLTSSPKTLQPTSSNCNPSAYPISSEEHLQ